MTSDGPIWGIHMGRDHGTHPVDEGYIAIGWDKVGDLSKVPPNREAFKNKVAQVYPSTKPGAIPVHAGTLYRFAVTMKVGDLVVYPSKLDRIVHIGTIASDYSYQPDAFGPNRRKVTWKKHIPRADFSQSALFEIGSAVTLFQIKNNAKEFISAYEGKPIDVDEVEVEAEDKATTVTSETAKETTTDFIIKRLKSELSTYEFEHFVSHVLECIGYHTRVTPQSGDAGVDILAHKDELGVEPPLIKVQCKQTIANIGQPDVAQLYGHIEDDEFGLFVTLGSYTAQAKHFERGKRLRLISGEELVELILEHYDRFDTQYKVLLPLKKTYVPDLTSAEDL